MMKTTLMIKKRNIHCTHQEACKLLGKYYNKRQIYENQTVTSGRRKIALVHNHFSTYTTALSKKTNHYNKSHFHYSSFILKTSNDIIHKQ